MRATILALLLASGCGEVSERLEQAERDRTRTAAQTFRSASALWLALHREGCPTAEQLVAEELVPTLDDTLDGWDRPLTIRGWPKERLRCSES